MSAWTAVLAAVLLWPLTRSGYLLGHDLVFTPQQPLDRASIGLSSSSPRAVPLDALVALAERLADGAVVGRIALLVPVVLAGLGAALVLRRAGVAGQLAGCSFAVWNPYVIERLSLGQWALLWSYAALPFVVLGARARTSRGRVVFLLALAGAAITPTGGVIAAVVAVAVVVGTRCPRRQVALVIGAAVVLQLPWLVPSVVGTAARTSDPRAVAAFAARGEFHGGPLLSLLSGGGGVWDAEVAPVSRGGALPWVALAVLVAATAYGWTHLETLAGRRLTRVLGGLAAVGVLVAGAAALPGGAAVTRTLVADVPGAGLLRDAQKWVMPLVLLEALLIGAAVDRIAGRVRAANWRAVLLAAAGVLPVLLLPDGATPVHATVAPVHYPPDWAAVAQRLAGRGGSAIVVPFTSYRRFAWAPGRSSVLDPAPRLLPVPTVVSDRLSVSGHLLRGEDGQAAAVDRAVRTGTDLPQRLAALGQRWVVVERDAAGPVPSLAGLQPVYRGAQVALYRVPGEVDEPRVSTARVVLVTLADALAVGLVLSVLAAQAVASVRRRRRRALL